MIRYPGSKAGLKKQILRSFPSWLLESLFQRSRSQIEYREPFFGGGAIGFDVLPYLPHSARVWINDKDAGIASLWRTVHEDHEWLLKRVSTFEPSVSAFEKFKSDDSRKDIDPRERGFRKLALHQMSYSGLGAMAGGPIGGVSQSNPNYDVGCRWSSDRHCADIVRCHGILRRFRQENVRIESGDFEKLISGDTAPGVFVYLDPPYYEKGSELYKFDMSDGDHHRLAAALRMFSGDWVLSYDDHQFIRALYGEWTHFESVDKTYTIAIAHEKRRKNSEVIITPRRVASEAVA